MKFILINMDKCLTKSFSTDPNKWDKYVHEIFLKIAERISNVLKT